MAEEGFPAYDVDPATAWCAIEHPDEPVIRSAVVARQLYVNFFPTGLFGEELRQHTELAHTFLSHTDEEFRTSAFLQNLFETAVPITEPVDTLPPDLPLGYGLEGAETFAAPRNPPPEVVSVVTRQAQTPYPVRGSLPIDAYPTLGIGVWPPLPVATPLPPLPT